MELNQEMPSSLASGPRARSIKGGSKVGRIVPDFIVTKDLSVDDFFDVNKGVHFFTVPADTRVGFLGGVLTYAVAGDDPIRIQVIRAASTAAPGSAAGTNIEDLTEGIPTNGPANTAVNFSVNATAPISGLPSFVALEEGDRVAVASALPLSGLAGAVLSLRFVWL
jgi:hypothetical protein